MAIHGDVDAAVKALVKAAAPAASVFGLDGNEAVLEQVGPGGRIIVQYGDPGDPEVSLSPLTYYYDRSIALDIDGTPAEVTAILVAIGSALEANRTLGGVVEFVDAIAPLIETQSVEGSPIVTSASATIVATYSTPHPL
jgi:hypothetical protein